jgi:hypothetical protein
MSMGVDGSSKRIVYNPEFYYPYWQVSVSNSGQIAIVADMTSKTYDDYYRHPPRGGLYRVDIREGTPVEMLASKRGEIIGLPTWSPSEEYVAYTSDSYLRILNAETGEALEPWEHPSIEPRFVWSPDGQSIAAIVATAYDMAFDREEHIYIFDIPSQTFQPLIQDSP